MALKGVSMAERTEFISPRDPGHPEHPESKSAIAEGKEPPKPTIFYIGNLTRAVRVRIGDLTTTPTMREGYGITMTTRRVERATECVLHGLVGWDNFLDDDDNQIDFTRGTQPDGKGGFGVVVSDECMQRLSADDILELSQAILERNGMTTELEKNFAGASLPFGGQPSATGDAPNAPTTKSESEVVLDEPKSDPA